MGKPIQVKCSSCGIVIAAEDLNLETMMARCRGCDVVFDFGDQVDGAPRGRAVAIPPGILFENSGGEVTIIRRWFSAQFIFLAFFTLAWDSFLVFWYSMAIRGDAPWIMIVFPIAHVAVGIGLTYSTLAGFVNRTFIRVGRGELSVRHAPMFWAGNRVLAVADIQDVRHHVCTSGKGARSYEVNIVTGGQRKLKLISLQDEDQALFIEQEVRKALQKG